MFGVRAVISHPLFSAVHSHYHKFTHSHIMSFFYLVFVVQWTELRSAIKCMKEECISVYISVLLCVYIFAHCLMCGQRHLWRPSHGACPSAITKTKALVPTAAVSPLFLRFSAWMVSLWLLCMSMRVLISGKKWIQVYSVVHCICNVKVLVVLFFFFVFCFCE